MRPPAPESTWVRLGQGGLLRARLRENHAMGTIASRLPHETGRLIGYGRIRLDSPLDSGDSEDSEDSNDSNDSHELNESDGL